MKVLLFFYGSLMLGYENNHRLSGQRFIGEVATEPLYRIIDLGRYNGLVHDQDGGSIRGELWEVDSKCLTELDEFEGGEGTFERQPIDVKGHSNIEAYFWTGRIKRNHRDAG